MKPRDPMTRLRRANPLPTSSAEPGSKRRALRRASQGLLALIGILAIGVGAAWAVSGVNPVAPLFEENVKVVESDFGLDSFSILEPMTEEKFDSLPRKTVQAVSRMAFSLGIRSHVESGGPVDLDEIMDENNRMPVGISAIGEATASTGSEVTMLVMDGLICTTWKYGAGNCTSLENIRKGITVGGSNEHSNTQLWRLNGIVTDEVHEITIDGSDLPPMPVTDNVFEFRNMPPRNLRLIGLDEDGNEVFRTGAPIAGWAGLG